MDVEPEQVAELQRQGAVQVVDVREPYEWDAGRIPGARHVGLAELTAQASTIDRDAPVVFVCRVGGRSTMAAHAFRRAGYDAYSLAGGMLAWAERGLPFDPEDGEVADH
jgi:rhodanese-related sulfurtransferase